MSVQRWRGPSYRLHKPTGLAAVTLGGREFYFGKYGWPESRAEYDRLMAEWLAHGCTWAFPNLASPSDLTVNEMAEA